MHFRSPWEWRGSFIAMQQTNTINDFKLLVDDTLLPYDKVDPTYYYFIRNRLVLKWLIHGL
jgi:hypothetical protein